MRAPLQLSNFWNTENPALVIANRFKQVGAGRRTQCRAHSRACSSLVALGRCLATPPLTRLLCLPPHSRACSPPRGSSPHAEPGSCLCDSNDPNQQVPHTLYASLSVLIKRTHTCVPTLKLRGQLFRTRRKLPESEKSQRLAWPSTQEISLASHCPSSNGAAASPLWLLGKPRNRKTALETKDHRRVRVQHTRERGPPRNPPP